jgi:large subunit ribosomal protein L21
MYAVIRTGGKQYKVTTGDVVDIERLPQEAGAEIEFDDVLMLIDGDDVRIGTPKLDGARVRAKIVEHRRADKVLIVKFRRRKHYAKRQGHRQWQSRVEITGIAAAAG